MDCMIIMCESCEQQWTADHSYSMYEQEMLESRPCPECGACTLSLTRSQEHPRCRQIMSMAYGKAS